MSNVVLCSVYAVLYLHNSHGDRGKEMSMRATGQAWSSDMVIAVSTQQPGSRVYLRRMDDAAPGKA